MTNQINTTNIMIEKSGQTCASTMAHYEKIQIKTPDLIFKAGALQAAMDHEFIKDFSAATNDQIFDALIYLAASAAELETRLYRIEGNNYLSDKDRADHFDDLIWGFIEYSTDATAANYDYFKNHPMLSFYYQTDTPAETEKSFLELTDELIALMDKLDDQSIGKNDRDLLRIDWLKKYGINIYQAADIARSLRLLEIADPNWRFREGLISE